MKFFLLLLGAFAFITGSPVGSGEVAVAGRRKLNTLISTTDVGYWTGGTVTLTPGTWRNTMNATNWD